MFSCFSKCNTPIDNLLKVLGDVFLNEYYLKHTAFLSTWILKINKDYS